MENNNTELFREIYEKTHQDKIAHSSHLHSFREMAKIGSVGDYKIYIYGGEGLIPHFHFIDIHTGKEGCIKILTNEYFNHGAKYTLILNSGERKELVNFFNSQADEEYFREGITNYKFMIQQWNLNNPENKISSNTPMPDYRNM